MRTRGEGAADQMNHPLPAFAPQRSCPPSPVEGEGNVLSNQLLQVRNAAFRLLYGTAFHAEDDVTR
jgi:hypothetical protein